jgi:lipoate-protein ligase A
MIYIETNSCLPFVNLAFEEYFLKSKDLGDDIFMLWQNEPTIVIGRFQNTLEEINQPFIESHKIHVVRRISGGGAVYHDLGNLCFTFIFQNITPISVDFSKFSIPVIKALAQFGIQIVASGRNDLTIEGKKISGTAMSLHKNRLLFHGTLLFDSDLDMLGQALHVSTDKFESKAIKSIRSRVTNIKPWIATDIQIDEFKQTLKEFIFGDETYKQYKLTDEDRTAIQGLVNNKYLKWEWNFGNNPLSKIKYSHRFPGGKLEFYLELEKGYLQSCQIMGDFLGLCDIEEVEERLKNIRYNREDIENVLDTLDINKFFGSITKEEILQCIMGL